MRSLSLSLMLLLVSSGAAAQSHSGLPAVFEALEGDWVGEGTLFGQPAQFAMTWTAQADGNFRLDFENGLVGADGTVTTVLTAEAVYSLDSDGRVVASWTDSRGESITISADVTDSVLLSDWASSSESGRTEYAVQADGTVQVRDWVRTGGELQPFGEAHYRKR